MTILAQSLLTLVSSHLVALLLLSVWHNLECLILNDFLLFHFLNETLRGLECREVVSIDNQSRVLGNVACGLGSTVLHCECSKATQVHVKASTVAATSFLAMPVSSAILLMISAFVMM